MIIVLLNVENKIEKGHEHGPELSTQQLIISFILVLLNIITKSLCIVCRFEDQNGYEISRRQGFVDWLFFNFTT